MSFEPFIGYANMALPAMLLALSVVRFKRIPRIVMPASAIAALLFFFHWMLIVFDIKYLSSPGLIGFIEIFAVLVLLAGVMTEDRDMNIHTLLMVILPVMILINAVLFVFVFIDEARQSMLVQLVPSGRLCIVLFGLLVFWSRGISAPHYAVQAFMFLCIGAGLDVAITLFPDQPSWVPIGSSVADTFAFFSMILYTEYLEADPGAVDIAVSAAVRSEAALAATDRIAAALAKIDVSLPDEVWFPQGLSVVAQGIQDALNYQCVGFVKWNGQDARVRAVDAFSANGHTRELQITLSSTAIAKMVAARDVIVSDNLREDARLVGCTFETLEWNSAAFITMPQKKDLVYILILGDRGDALPFGDDDAAAIRKIKPHIDVFFSFLHSRSELYSVSNFDPVTHQHNYSAFQRILARAMDESDKGGGTFALALFDVDKFYILNEKLGYEPGDQVLRELGNMIREFTEDRQVGRVGADEFAIILHGDADSIRGRLENILSQIKRKTADVWPDLPLSLSVAFTMYPYDFLEQMSVFGKMREALAAGASSMGKLLRVKCS